MVCYSAMLCRSFLGIPQTEDPHLRHGIEVDETFTAVGISNNAQGSLEFVSKYSPKVAISQSPLINSEVLTNLNFPIFSLCSSKKNDFCSIFFNGGQFPNRLKHGCEALRPHAPRVRIVQELAQGREGQAAVVLPGRKVVRSDAPLTTESYVVSIRLYHQYINIICWRILETYSCSSMNYCMLNPI